MGNIKYPIVNNLKQCGACGQWKPLSEFNKARNYYTSRCKDCLKTYSHNYRETLEMKAKQREYQKEYISNPQNREKKNAYLRRYRKQEFVRARVNKNRRQWALREKQKAVDYKGGKCEICGYDRCLACLDFHHKDPTQKNGYGIGVLKHHWTFEKNKSEIDKCILLCVRCHREIHAGVTQI